ncbi:MAG: ABC transporter permease [Clostridia bacterium]|nr:ABC transporter permease [Clostridia bacterium]
MRKHLYLRMAAVNVKNHKRLFIPFILACAGCAAMFDIMLTLTRNCANILTRGGSGTLEGVMITGCIVVGFFSVFIVFYANSYIVKRRGKEFGLYNVLGMEKRHIAKVMALESLISFTASIATAIIAASLFSRLLVLVLYKFVNIPSLTDFELSLDAVLSTVALFLIVFILMYIYNVSRVGFSSSIQLLRSGNAGEKEPRTKWPITVLGVLTLGGGYYMALTIKDPAIALALFFIAVILVIIGTYCLFTSGSIAMLKGLKRNKVYYYKPNHFISVSGMIYRMKQNAVGLANICILSTMVLVMLSSTICMYSGMNDAIRRQFPRDISFNIKSDGDKDISDEAVEDMSAFISAGMESYKGKYEGMLSYRHAYFELVEDEGVLRSIGESMDFVDYSRRVYAYIIPLSDYAAITGFGEAGIMQSDTALIYAPFSNFEDDSIAFGDEVYKAVPIDDPGIDATYPAAGGSALYIIVPSVEDIANISAALDAFSPITLQVAFDVNTSDDEQIAIYDEMRNLIRGHMSEAEQVYAGAYLSSSCAATTREEYMSLYGGLLFLGMFLGLMFTMAAALIMYYRQISEGYEDSGRYEIMRNVGMSTREIASCIKSQVLTVFFLPLAAAGVHILMAFPMISVMFQIFRLTNIALFATSTAICFAAFAVIYLSVYALTARTYYHIVTRPAI